MLQRVLGLHSLLLLNISFSGICYILFIHSSVDGLSGGFHFLAAMRNTAMNIPVRIFVQFPFCWVFTWSGIAGSCGNCL